MSRLSMFTITVGLSLLLLRSDVSCCQEITISFGPEWEDVVGLDFADGYFWVADNYLGFDGTHSRVHVIDPETGIEVSVINTPISNRVNARDIVVVGDSIFQPEDGPHRIHRYSKVDGSLIETFSHDGRFPWGIASDGVHLFVLETENPQQIQKREISSPTYPYVARFPWPNPRQSGLTFVKGFLYRILTNTGTDPVQRLDPDTGAVLETIPLPPSLEAQLEKDVAVVRDLAFDGNHFWFHLRLTPDPRPDKLIRAPSGWGGICSYGPADGPYAFTRTNGKPTPDVVEWDSCGGPGEIQVTADGVNAALIYLNGELLFGPNIFRHGPLEVSDTVSLNEGKNVLSIELRGQPGGAATVAFIDGADQ